MHHAFDVDYAAEYGIQAAILIAHFEHWIRHNRATGRHYHDGRTWSYQTLEDIAAHFPYLTKDQVSEIIKFLCTGKPRRSVKEPGFEPVLMRGNYNKSPFDKTTWYAFVNEEKFTKLAIANIGVGDCQNGSRQLPAPIPHTKSIYCSDDDSDSAGAEDQKSSEKIKLSEQPKETTMIRDFEGNERTIGKSDLHRLLLHHQLSKSDLDLIWRKICSYCAPIRDLIQFSLKCLGNHKKTQHKGKSCHNAENSRYKSKRKETPQPSNGSDETSENDTSPPIFHNLLALMKT